MVRHTAQDGALRGRRPRSRGGQEHGQGAPRYQPFRSPTERLARRAIYPPPALALDGIAPFPHDGIHLPPAGNSWFVRAFGRTDYSQAGWRPSRPQQ